MAETSLGRASLSVTADLSGFTSALDAASQKTNQLSSTNDAMAAAANKVTVATEQQTQALADLQKAAVDGVINLANNKQQALATKLATDALVQQDGATLILMQDQKKLDAGQAKLVTGSKQLENSLLKTDMAFRNNTFEIQKNIQKQQLYEQSQKSLMTRMAAVDQESIKMTAIQKKLATETDIAAKKMDLQARQMLIESGAAAKLAKELAELEEMEEAIIACETTIQNTFKKTTKVMEQAAQATSVVVAKQKIEPPKQPKSGMGITDYLGIGLATAAFTKFFDILSTGFSAAVGWVTGFVSKVVSAGAQFEQANARLKALTGSTALAKGLQDIMKAGPSASFDAMVEHATRLAALKFSPASIQMLMGSFNQLGIALGNPERIMALITDKIADMASEGQATIPALSKLAEEGIPVWDALAARLSRTTGRMVSVAEAQSMVANGMVNVSEASAAIGDAANMPGMKAAAEAAANSFTGVWQTVANNLSVLFQKVGGYFVEGFRLESLSAGVQDLFTAITVKIEEMKPWFLKAGAFIASAIKVGQEAVTEFLDSWSVAVGEVDLEEILAEAKLAALDFGMQIIEGARAAKTALVEIYNQVKKIVDLIIENAAMLDVQGALTPASGLASSLAAQAVANASLTATPALNDLSTPAMPPPPADDFFTAQIKRMEEQRKRLEEQRLNIRVDYWLNAMLGEESADFAGITDQLEGMGEAARLAAEEADHLWEMMNPPAQVERFEEPPWKKFLAENLTPLQQYQREIAKLELMLDGSEEGFAAFAMGSATALKKLKDATGLGEIKFASAITAGSAEDFKATLDAQNQNVDVQQQIRELMQAAQEIQQQQLDAQIEIAQAIRNQRMPKGVNVMAGG